MPTSQTVKNGSNTAEQGLIAGFLRWYFVERPHAIVALYGKYAKALSESFALLFMLKTLISPWKRITDEYPSKGWNFEEIAATFFLNLTSRAIGFLIRIVTIITGIAIQIILVIGFAVYLILWIFYPVLILLAIPALSISF
jgi:hypothetical protein